MTDKIKTKKDNSRIIRDWTQGSIIGNLIKLSWPMIGMEATYMLSQIFDMIWVGKSGPSSIAAIGISSQIMMVTMLFDLALISGGRAMISRFIGAKDKKMAHKAAGQVYIMAVSWGLIISIGGFLLAGKLINLFVIAPDVAGEGTRYLKIVFAGWIFMELLVMSLYIMQASGDSLNPMKLEFFMRAIHVTLSPFLILGLWIFPPLGITGAAISNVLSQAIGAGIGLFLLFSGRTRLRLRLRDFRFIPNISWRILKIGIPGMVSMGQMSIANVAIMKLIVPFGTPAIAAHSLVSNVFGIMQTISMGMGNGVGVLVGQNLGAGKTDQAVKTTWTGAGILQAFSVFCGIFIFILAEKIVLIFSSNQSLIDIGSAFLRISIIGLLGIAFNSSFMNCISGAGDTMPNMIINIMMTWAILIPLAIFLSRFAGLDAYGIRWAMSISTIAGAIATFAYFQGGRWKRKNV